MQEIIDKLLSRIQQLASAEDGISELSLAELTRLLLSLSKLKHELSQEEAQYSDMSALLDKLYSNEELLELLQRLEEKM